MVADHDRAGAVVWASQKARTQSPSSSSTTSSARPDPPSCRQSASTWGRVHGGHRRHGAAGPRVRRPVPPDRARQRSTTATATTAPPHSSPSSTCAAADSPSTPADAPSVEIEYPRSRKDAGQPMFGCPGVGAAGQDFLANFPAGVAIVTAEHVSAGHSVAGVKLLKSVERGRGDPHTRPGYTTNHLRLHNRRSEAPFLELGGRCRIRTCEGILRRIYSPLPLAARATCRVRLPQ